MLHKSSPDPMENSSGYVSNTNSMNPPVKYATVGRSRPGGVKRTTSLTVTQPVVPPPKPLPTKLAPVLHKDVRKHYKNDLSRPSSRASRSSANSDPRRPSSRSSRDVPSERLSRHHRTGSRRSYSKVRRPESRTSSKALILRRRGSGRRVANGAKRSSSIRSGRSDEQRNIRPSSRSSQHSQRSAARREPERSKTSIFSSWKPRLTLRRSKSMQVKPEEMKKREIRFGDGQEAEIIMMKGVEHRSRSDSESKSRNEITVKSHHYANHSPGKRVSQTLNRASKRTNPPSRSDRASSMDVSKRLAPVGESAQEDEESPRSPRARRYMKNETGRNRPSSLSPGKQRPPSETSSSPRPRAPVWRTDSDGSMSDTLTNHSMGSNGRANRQSEHYAARDQRSRRARTQEPSTERHRSTEKSSVLNFLRRTFSMKPKEKPAKPASVKKRERASSSSVSSLERPVRHSKMKTAKSHELLNRPDEDLQDEKQQYRSLPRRKQKQHGGGTTLSRRLSSLGWAAAGGRLRPERSRSFKDERTCEAHANNVSPSRRHEDPPPRNNERMLSTHSPKAVNEATRGQSYDDEPIRPIWQERRALSQPSLNHPPATEPSEEPFSHYANLPFQLPPRRRSSPNLLADAQVVEQQPAASQSSLRARRSGSSRSSSSSSTLHADERRREKHETERKRPPGKSILKQQKSEELKNTNVTREETMMRKQKSNVFQDIAHNIKNVFRQRKSGEKLPVGEGYVAGPGEGIVSERFVNVTSSHEETESAREEETVHQLGHSPPHQGMSRAIRDGVDARQLSRQEGGPASGASGQPRLLHQSARTWRTVHTDDTHETSRRDRHGDLVTESAHTRQREHYHNMQVPDDSEAPEGGVEERRSAQRSRRHTRDVDMREHFSVPRGGRLADAIKLGDGLRYVQEDVQETQQGDAGAGSISERIRDLRQLDFRPNGQVTIEHQPGEKHRRHQTSSWLSNHFGSDSGQSHSSGEEGRARDSRAGRDEKDRHRETGTYEYQRSSGAMQKGNAPPKSWEKSERYTQQVRETPEKTYVREARESSHGGHDRLTSGGAREPISDMQSEIDEDPIFASKFSSGKSRGLQRGGVAFSAYISAKPEPDQPSPPLVEEDPPAPSPPPRTKRKNRLKPTSPQSARQPQKAQPSSTDRVSAASHSSERRREHNERPRRVPGDGSAPQQEDWRRQNAPGTVSTHRREDGTLVKEYRFSNSERPRDSTPVYRESSSSRRDSPQRPARRGSSSARQSPPATKTYFGQQRSRSHSTDEPDGGRAEARYTTTLNRRLGDGNEKRFHRSTDELDRRPAEPTYRAFTIDRRLGKTAHEAAKQGAFQSQTLPRNPRETRNSPPTRNGRLPNSSRYGGSMINVSVKNNVRTNPTPPRKPDRSPVRRSNSLYSKEGHPEPASLKSPNILSQIQRTASLRRSSVDGSAPPAPPPPPAPTSPATTPMRAFEAQRRRTEGHESRASVERSQVIPVSITAPDEEPPRSPRSPTVNFPPKVAPKPSSSITDNFMRGLMQTAPELYSALHKDERKDSKTPSPKQSPPMTPPPPLHRARSPMSPQPLPIDYGAIYPKTPPVFKRMEALRADEEVVTKEGRSRSTTPAENVANFRLGTMSSTGERTDVIKVQR